MTWRELADPSSFDPGDRLWRFSTLNSTWTFLDPMIIQENCLEHPGYANCTSRWLPRFTGPMAVVGSDIYMHGSDLSSGQQDTGAEDGHLYRFSTLTLAWTALDTNPALGTNSIVSTWPSKLQGHSMATIGSDFYIYGGSQIVWRFSTITGMWTLFGSTVSSPGLSEALYAMAVVGSDLYVLGEDELWRFSTLTHEWVLKSVAEDAIRPSARKEHKMVAVTTFVYLFGGCCQPEPNNYLSLDDTWYFSTMDSTVSWTLLDTEGPGGRQRHAMTTAGGKVYLHGGYNDDLCKFMYERYVHIHCLRVT